MLEKWWSVGRVFLYAWLYFGLWSTFAAAFGYSGKRPRHWVELEEGRPVSGGSDFLSCCLLYAITAITTSIGTLYSLKAFSSFFATSITTETFVFFCKNYKLFFHFFSHHSTNRIIMTDKVQMPTINIANIYITQKKMFSIFFFLRNRSILACCANASGLVANASGSVAIILPVILLMYEWPWIIDFPVFICNPLMSNDLQKTKTYSYIELCVTAFENHTKNGSFSPQK